MKHSLEQTVCWRVAVTARQLNVFSSEIDGRFFFAIRASLNAELHV